MKRSYEVVRNPNYLTDEGFTVEPGSDWELWAKRRVVYGVPQKVASAVARCLDGQDPEPGDIQALVQTLLSGFWD
jgi:hypothetical protein